MTINYQEMFNHLYPDFFAKSAPKDADPAETWEELAMELKLEAPVTQPVPCPEHITFGWYNGDTETLQKAVATVDEDWPEYFQQGDRVYCAFDGDRIASFCLVDTMGEYQGLRIGGPGCVGTVPEYRRQGIGLRMVQKATDILRKEGFDISFIHYTAVGRWYEKLGYQTVLEWNKNGFVNR